jgi:hypothetical protein
MDLALGNAAPEDRSVIEHSLQPRGFPSKEKFGSSRRRRTVQRLPAHGRGDPPVT